MPALVNDTPTDPTDRPHRSASAIVTTLVAVAIAGAFVLAGRHDSDPVVVVEDPPETTLPGTRASGTVSPFAPVAPVDEAEEPACDGLQPGPSWNCHDGQWQLLPPAAPLATGGGRSDRAAGCLTEQPGPSLVCQDGLWVIAGTAPSGSSSRDTPAEAGERGCPGPAPGSEWSCADGAWIPPDQPLPGDVPPAPPPALPPATEPDAGPPAEPAVPVTGPGAPTAPEN